MAAAAVQSARSRTERRNRRDRVVVIVALITTTAVAWAYLLRTASEMDMARTGTDVLMPPMRMPIALDVFSLFIMWSVMMIAMMLPSATPTVLLIATINRQRRERARPAVPTTVFIAGYLLVWTAFSLAAALAQCGLRRAALLTPSMVSASPLFSGILLITAGAYQWTPIKNTCLSRCRSPLGFISSEWREGWTGALAMGLRHGLTCLGCCWPLMALLFVAGVMNIVWIATIAGMVLLEKLAPAGPAIARAMGGVFVAWGAYLVLS